MPAAAMAAPARFRLLQPAWAWPPTYADVGGGGAGPAAARERPLRPGGSRAGGPLTAGPGRAGPRYAAAGGAGCGLGTAAEGAGGGAGVGRFFLASVMVVYEESPFLAVLLRG